MSPEFAKAFVKAQGEIEGAVKDKRNPGFNSKYADLSACWDACREALQANGIGVLQEPALTDKPEHVRLATTLVHSATGEMRTSHFDLPVGGKKDAQAVGSAITYARRYALCAVIGICPEDDDGNKATGKTAPKEEPKKTVPLDPQWALTFAGITDNDQRKVMYMELKNAVGIDEKAKAELLAAWAKVIKANGQAEGAKENQK